MALRTASEADLPILVGLVNAAFVVESFFKIGDRTSERECRQMMQLGEFLLLDDPPGTPVGCVYIRPEGARGYFGMLAVDPARQGRGYGRRLIEAAEEACRTRGCRAIDVHIVNLREELPALYRRFGYVESGTLPFTHTQHASRPCHFVVMTKNLEPRVC